jgi:hypothetical protein
MKDGEIRDYPKGKIIKNDDGDGEKGIILAKSNAMQIAGNYWKEGE